MHRAAKPGKPRRSGKARTFLAWASLALGAAGCSSPQVAQIEKSGDPLLGANPGPLVNPTPAQAAAPPGGASAQAGTPPLPPSGLSTNAALASQSPTAHSLAIGEPPGEGWQRNIQGTPAAAATAAGSATPVSQPKVLPVPKDTSVTASSSQSVRPAGSWASNTPSSSAATPTAQDLEKLLVSRGVMGHKEFDVPGGGVRLVCAVPAGTSNQIYDVTAADFAAAVQAVVRQIDEHHAP
jgi:hypothetical protein